MWLGKEISFWREKIEEISKEFTAIEIMKEEMPGLGQTTAATLYAELGDPKRFKNEKAYAKATGLTPGYRSSGGKQTGTTLSRAGSSRARWALTQAALACLRCKGGAGGQVKQWILSRAQGRKRKKVVVAAGRKLAEGIWRLFNLEESFDLARAFGGKAKVSSVSGG